MGSYPTTLALCAYLAWGLATSPLPLAGLAVILLAKSPGRAAGVFTAAWFGCQVVALTFFTASAHFISKIKVGPDEKHKIAYALLAVAVAMAVSGVWLYLRDRRHPSPKNGQRTRDFLHRAETAGPRQAVWLAILTAGLNITNLPYWVAIGLIIERSHLPADQRASLVLITSVIASSTFILITGAVIATGDRFTTLLTRGRDFVLRHSSSVVPGFLLGSAVGVALVAANDLGWL